MDTRIILITWLALSLQRLRLGRLVLLNKGHNSSITSSSLGKEIRFMAILIQGLAPKELLLLCTRALRIELIQGRVVAWNAGERRG